MASRSRKGPTMKYQNPIIPGFYPDPSVCRVDDDYYLVTSTFEYFPGVPIFHSRNLVNWRQIGHCLTRTSQLPLSDSDRPGGIYAPTLRHHNGRFYMVTTNMRNGGNFLVWTDDPEGEWSEPFWIDEGGIDPDLFWDDDGTCYFTNSRGQQRRIDPDTGALLSERVQLWTGTGGHSAEAPHLYKKDDFYYLIIAEGGTEYGHCVTMARSPTAQGPWEACPHNPILTHRSKMKLPIQATGHADLVQDARGSWWMVCLGIRPKPKNHLGRETFLAPVEWVDGWPVINDCAEIALEMEGHDGLPCPTEQSWSTRDDFDRHTLPLHWNFHCNPAPEAWTLEGNALHLTCVAQDLSRRAGKAWIGRRQQHFNFRATANIEFSPEMESEEAGLTVFYDTTHHYEIAVTLRNGQKCLIVRRTIGTLTAEVASTPAPDGKLSLVIEGDERDYSLGFVTGENSPLFLAKGETKYLSAEVAGFFTGVYLAMYATGNGCSRDRVAHFNWFDYNPDIASGACDSIPGR